MFVYITGFSHGKDWVWRPAPSYWYGKLRCCVGDYLTLEVEEQDRCVAWSAVVRKMGLVQIERGFAKSNYAAAQLAQDSAHRFLTIGWDLTT